jgi:hypothetical protein
VLAASAKTELSTRLQHWLAGSDALKRGTGGVGGEAPEGRSPLPRQDSNNCNELPGKSYGNGRKTAFALEQNVVAFLLVTGIARVGFLTLTFADHVTDPKEAQRRWHSLRTAILKRRYLRILRVFERQKSGRIHFHVLVALRDDIRTGFCFDDAARGVYRSANGALRSEWAFWRRTASLYGFGRTELLPIKSPGAMGKYVGKYIGKHLDARLPEDKGVRLAQCSQGWKAASSQFSWNSPGAWCYRQKLRSFAVKRGCGSMADLRRLLGRSWGHTHRDAIALEPLRFYPTCAHARADGRNCNELPEDATDIWFDSRPTPAPIMRGIRPF